MEIKEYLTELVSKNCIGNETGALLYAKEMFGKYCDTVTDNFSGFTALLKGKSDYTVLLDAHIDEVGFIVTGISDEFLTVDGMGGIDLRTLAACPVTVHGKKEIPAVFSSVPPHLSSDDEVPENISDLKIDTGIKNVSDYVSVGDTVTYRTAPREMLNGRISAKSVDNRAGVAALLKVAENLSLSGEVPVTVKFQISGMEELGMRGARTSAYENDCDEALAVDVSFGDSPDISRYECKKLGTGAMIGISPVLSKEITDKITKIAKEKEICHTFEVMGGKTSTNADAIAVTKSGIKTGLISVPIRNMHTCLEVADVADIEDTAEIITEYILSGGLA